MRSDEFINLSVEFIQTLSPRVKRVYSIRDNCGPCTLEFIDWAKSKGVDLHRVSGYFRADEVVYDKADFTKEMKKEFLQTGGNFNDPSNRKEWIENSRYAEEWHNIPHYWAEDSHGTIFDPAGHLQFKELATDLSPLRYIK